MKTKIVLITLLNIIIFASCGNKKGEPDAYGSFESTEIIISSEVNGKITSLQSNEGDEIKKAVVIATIDSTQLYLKKRQLQAMLSAVKSKQPDVLTQLSGLITQIETAKTEKNRIERLLSSEIANKKQLDDIVAQIKVLENNYAAQKSNLNASTASLESEMQSIMMQILQTEDLLKKCKIQSPIDGTLLLKYIEEGELTVPGKALFKIADTKNMILRCYVNAPELSKMQIGDSVKIATEVGEGENKMYEGKISWISSKAEFSPKSIQSRESRDNLVYAVKIAVKNDGFLRIGMYGSMYIDN